VRAIVYKDLISMRRDMRRLASVLPGVAMAVAYPLLFRLPSGARGLGEIGFWAGMAGSAFIPFMLSMLFALPAIGQEGRGIQLLTLAGTRPATILRAKLTAMVPLVSVLSLAGATATAMFHGADVAGVLAVLGVIAWFSAGLATIGVSAGALAPNFAAADPRRAVRFEGVLAGMVGDALFSVLSGGAVAVALFAAHAPGGGAVALMAVAFVLAAGAAGVVAGFVALALNALGRYRFENT
jgi:hypothetical protein